MWHQHQWTETSRRFNPPEVVPTKWEGTNSDMLLQLVYGITVIELRCTDCGDVKGVRYTGSVS